jgi:hypothetical protein
MTSQEWKGLLGGAIVTIGFVLAWTIGPRSQLPYFVIVISIALVAWILTRRRSR